MDEATNETSVRGVMVDGRTVGLITVPVRAYVDEVMRAVWGLAKLPKDCTPENLRAMEVRPNVVKLTLRNYHPGSVVVILESGQLAKVHKLSSAWAELRMPSGGYVGKPDEEFALWSEVAARPEMTEGLMRQWGERARTRLGCDPWMGASREDLERTIWVLIDEWAKD